jgi:hypothetical protein
MACFSTRNQLAAAIGMVTAVATTKNTPGGNHVRPIIASSCWTGQP